MTDYEKEYRKHPAVCGEPFKEFETFFRQLPLKYARVLDLGCGQGRDALMIAKLGHHVHGVDLSPTGVQQMVESAQTEGLDVTGEVANIITYQPSSNFHVVIIDRVLHMLATETERLTVLETMSRRVLAEGYVLIADTLKNLPAIEKFFENRSSWKLILSKKGYRFFQKVAP